MESVLYNVSFWLIVNVFLAAAVVGLILIRYSLTRSTPKTDEARAKGMDFSPELETFQKLVSRGEYAEAVSQTFATCFVKLCSFYGVEGRSVTPRELLDGGRLTPYVGEIFGALYEVYEPVRFARLNPTPEMLSRFRECLEKLNRGAAGFG